MKFRINTEKKEKIEKIEMPKGTAIDVGTVFMICKLRDEFKKRYLEEREKNVRLKNSKGTDHIIDYIDLVFKSISA